MRDMKDSGLDWITEIPKDWKVDRLKYKFSFGKGLPITKDNLEDEGIAVISYGQVHSKANTGTNIDDELIRYVNERYLRTNAQSLVHKNDFIFADTSEDLTGCGNCVYIDKEMQLFAGYHTIILRALNEDTKYFSYLFLTDEWRKQLREKVSGVKLFSVTQKIIKEAGVIIPPIEEQKKITAYLDKKCDEIDKLCENIQEQIDILEEQKQSIINEKVLGGLKSDIHYKDSVIGFGIKIPQHWKELKTGYLFKENVRPALADDIPLSLSQIDGLIPTDEMKESSLKAANYNNWKHVVKNDLVLNRFKAHLGVMFTSKYVGMVSFHYGVYEAQKKLCSKYYEYLYHTNVYRTLLGGMSNGMTVGLQNLSNQNFYSVISLFPPYEEQKEIVEYLSNITIDFDETIKMKRDQLVTLEQYKKSLVYEYVTGKKEVPNE